MAINQFPVSATVNWAVPGALGSTTPNSVYVAQGDANRIAFFGGTGGKQILSSSYFTSDLSGNGTLGVQANATSFSQFAISGGYGYVVGGTTGNPSLFGIMSNANSAAAGIYSNIYWDPDSGAVGNWIYCKTGGAALISTDSGQVTLYSAPSGTAGTAASLTGYLQVTANGLYSSPFISGVTSKGSTFGVGYATGAGGSVTQLTSKSTAVTLNNICGKIQMAANSLAGNTNVSFTLNNSTIAATDVVIVNASNVGGSSPTANTYMVTVDSVLAGSCRILVRNVSAVSASQALILNFAVIKAVQA